MPVSSRSWPVTLVLAGLFAACSSPPAVTSAPPPVTAPPVASSAPARVAPAASASVTAAVPAGRLLCGPLLEGNRRVLEGAPDAPPAGDVKLTETCYPTPLGAWALRLRSWTQDVEESTPVARGQLEVVYLSGATEQVWPKAPEGIAFAVGYGQVTSVLQTPRLVDVDRDGEPELFFAIDGHETEGPSTTTATLLTARGGTVKPYAGLPERVEGMEDVDHDGTMDFLFFPYEQTRTAPCSGFDYTWRGPELLAHGRPDGTFVLDDEVTRAHARRACPQPPGAPAAKKAGDGPDPMATSPEVCARLWGKSEAEAVKRLRAECRPVPKGGNDCQPPKGQCAEYEDREKSARQAPPVVIR